MTNLEKLVNLPLDQWEAIVEGLKTISSVPDSVQDQKSLLSLFFRVREFSKRKYLYPELNRLISETILTEKIFPIDLNPLDESFIPKLQAFVEAPNNSVVFVSFKLYIENEGQEIFNRLVEELNSFVSTHCANGVPGILPNQSELHQVLRLIQTIPVLQKNNITFPTQYRECLVTLLAGYNDSFQRDLVTVLGNTLAAHFATLEDDHFWKPLARMAYKRGLLAHASGDIAFPEIVDFFTQFVSTGSGSEIHYALQSIEMVLRKRTREDPPIGVSEILKITSLCLHSWDHQLQMVATVCRELFSSMCKHGGDGLEVVLVEIEKLEKFSKKRFNALFALSGYMEVWSEKLVEEILVSIRTCCPSIAGACQLLTALVDRSGDSKRELIVHQVSNFILEHETEADLDQLMMSLSRTKNCKISPCVSMLEKISKSQKCSSALSLKLLQFILMTPTNCVEFSNDAITVNGEIVFEKLEIEKFLVSSDSSLVTSATVLLLRMPPHSIWQSLLITPLVTRGGLITLGCCNDDRSIVSNELRCFFERNVKESSHVQLDLFNALIRESMRPDSLQEESQLALEALVNIDNCRVNEFVRKSELSSDIFTKILDGPLRSRWRKIRLLAKSLFGKFIFSDKENICAKNLHKILQDEVEDELIECVVTGLSLNDQREFLSTFIKSCGPISRPNIPYLTALSYINQSSVFSDEYLSYLCAVLVMHSRTVGEACFDWLIRSEVQGVTRLLAPYATQISSSMFRGNVDCRGHPICELGNEKSIIAWTSAKAVVNAIKFIMMDDQKNIPAIFEILSTLLLSVKHPALIVPIQSCFDVLAKKFPEIAYQETLVPLLETLENENPTRQLPAALRRSQGLGPLVSAVVRSQLNVAFVGSIVTRLLNIISNQNSSENSLHAINILRSIVRDSTIPDRFLEPHIARIMSDSILILDSMGDEFWRIRSAATQLFVQSARRFIGADNEDDWTANNGLGKSKSRKIVSAIEFFLNRNDAERLVGDFKRVLSKTDESVIVSVLSVLQSLSKFGEFVEKGGEELWDLIVTQLQTSPSAHVRRLAARIVARAAHEMRTVEKILATWAASNLHANEMHAYLCLLENLVSLNNETGIKFARKITASPLNHNVIGCELMVNSFIRLACNSRVNKEAPPWLLEREISPLILEFLATVDEDDASFNDLVLAHCLETSSTINHPVYRLLIAHLVESGEINVEEKILPEWLKTGFDFGIALCVGQVNEMTLELRQWMSSLNVLSEEMHDQVKIMLARNSFFRTSAAEKHAQLLMDESPHVRLAASVDGKNAVESLASILPKCEIEFLKIVAMKEIVDELDEYRLRYHAREIARNLLATTAPRPSPRIVV